MPMQNAAQGRHADSLLVGIETEYGVAPTDNFISGSFYTHGLHETRQTVEDPVLGIAAHNGRDTSAITEGLPNVAGDLVVPMCLNFMGDVLRWVFGAPVTTGSGPYTHVFESGKADLPSCAVQLPRRVSGATTKYQGFTGLAANNLRLEARKAEGVQRLTLGLTGRSEDAPTETVVDASPTIRDYAPIAAMLNKITLGGIEGQIMAASLNYSNNLVVQNDLDGTPYATGVEAGPSALSLTVTARYRDESIMDVARAGTEQAIALDWVQSASASLNIAVPVVRIARRGAPVEGPGGMDLQFEMIARQTSSAPMLTATLKNALPGAQYGAA